MIIQAKTKLLIDAFVKAPSHALQLQGEEGTGKSFLAQHIAENILGANLLNHPYVLQINSDTAIGIGEIRQLQTFLQLKTTGNKPVRRVVIIHDAHTMTQEAQNALLKSLEEPPKDTLVLLTVSDANKLFDTIHSRTQKVSIDSLDKQQAVDQLSKLSYSSDEITKAFALSGGRAGLMLALLDKSNQHSLAAAIDDAKKLYAQTAFERLTSVDIYAKDKDLLIALLKACAKICQGAIEQAADKGSISSLKSWHQRLAVINDAQDKLAYNPNAKLLLTDVFMNM